MESGKRVIKGRFAPSPTGRMHLGNVWSALLSWLSIKSQGGKWVLRIEDLDPGRSRLEFARLIEDDLNWLGLNWDEGGLSPAETDAASAAIAAAIETIATATTTESSSTKAAKSITCNRVPGEWCQSMRGHIYEEYLQKLNALGLTYPCWCTRADILATQAPHENDGRIVYAGSCRPGSPDAAAIAEKGKQAGRQASTRLIVPNRDILYTDRKYGPQRVNLAEHCGDFILRRADGAWAYQLAVVVDDALMGVTEVVRGRDLLLSAAQQIYLYEILGLPIPEFAHLPLLCSESGERLCKRDRSLDMGELRRHCCAEEIVGWLAWRAGLQIKPEPCTPASLIPLFSWDKIPTNDIRCPQVL